MVESVATPMAEAEFTDRLAEVEASLAAEVRRTKSLNRIAASIGANMSLQTVVQTVVDGGVELSGAAFGAFFYNVIDPAGERYTLYALSGAPEAAFAGFPTPRNTEVFAPTFDGVGVVRSDDIRADPRYGKNAPYHGMPKGHLPVRSYLAVPVISRSGEVLGGLFFGHPDVSVFQARDEEVVAGLGAQAAVAIDNVRLHEMSRLELEERRLAQQRQRLLLNELNHRVKNTLATVQSIAGQTLRSCADPVLFRQAFEARLSALSDTHNLLNAEGWDGAGLTALLRSELRPYDPAFARLAIDCDSELRLNPNATVALGMAVHELATNAVKYGALSTAAGRITVKWRRELAGEGSRIHLHWIESGGPKVTPPQRTGFGARLLERGLANQLAGQVRLQYDPDGLHCYMNLALAAVEHSP
jgi:two-component sensor histidine kinase